MNLDRFRKAHSEHYQTALSEIKNGRKISHWMWYVFPQIKGLGLSETSRYYAIKNIAEAKEFLRDEYLGGNLCEITEVLLSLPGNDATEIFGPIDYKKLRSSMTLFAEADPSKDSIFQAVLDKFFAGKPDPLTLKLLGRS